MNILTAEQLKAMLSACYKHQQHCRKCGYKDNTICPLARMDREVIIYLYKKTI